MSLHPIIIFAFNRYDSLVATVESLKANPESIASDLIFFVDGPRVERTDDIDKVNMVRDYVKTVNGFKSIKYYFADHNKGLAPSIIDGVSKIMAEYGSAIVLEDDLYVSRSFLRFMNQMLDIFKNDERIFQISGFSTKLNIQINTQIYLTGRARSWSWATWKDRWDTVDWTVSDYPAFISNKSLQRKFNTYGSDLSGMLKNYMEGRISSWYIRFCYSMYKQGRYTVCPVRSLVRNDGFNGEATHCNNYNRYKIDFELEHSGPFYVSSTLVPQRDIMMEASKYWSLKYRVYGKIMTYLYKIFRS